MTDEKWERILKEQRSIRKRREESHIDYHDLQPSHELEIIGVITGKQSGEDE